MHLPGTPRFPRVLYKQVSRVLPCEKRVPLPAFQGPLFWGPPAVRFCCVSEIGSFVMGKALTGHDKCMYILSTAVSPFRQS